MARVKGIISAGLASAGATQAIDYTKQDNNQAVDYAKKTEERIKAARQTSRETASTDLLKSGLAGAGAGFVFGPIGGLLTMGVAKLLTDRNRKGLEAYRVQSAANAEAIIGQSLEVIEELEANATTDQERAEAAMLRKEFEVYQTGSYNPDPNVSGAALVKMQELTGTLYDNLDDWQTERRESELDAQAENKRNFDIADNIRGDVQREASRYIASVEAFDKMEALKSQGSAVSDSSLIYALANLNDPGAIVTDGDISTLSTNPAISDELLRIYSSVLKGEGKLSEKQRAEVFEVGRAIAQQQVGYQLERNDLAIERARMANLSPEYQQSVVIPIPDSLRSRVQKPTPVPLEDVPDEYSEVTQGTAASIISTMGQGFQNIMEDVGRANRGESLMISDEGHMVVRDASGKIIEDKGYAQEWKNADGDLIRRVETPNGVLFQNVTQEERMRKEAPYNQAGRDAYNRAQQRGGTLRPVNE